jgi:beta-glucosidase
VVFEILKSKKMKKIVLLLIVLILVVIFPFPKNKKEGMPQYNPQDLKFPQGFFWGAATAAHQVEGNNDNQLTDWEKANAERLAANAEAKFSQVVPNWDQIKPFATDPKNYISGVADDHYNLYEQDLNLARDMGLNSYRFSIEWSRIEPTEGQFNAQELEHYRQVIAAAKARGLTPFVTLWHRSQPKWINAQGDWENPKTIENYTKFVEYVVSAFKDDVDYWMPFNEPTLHVLAGYIEGALPPEIKSFNRATKAFNNMTEAHRQAYKIIHDQDAKAYVASTQALQYTEADPNNIANKILVKVIDYQANFRFLDATKNENDFIAIQYYGPTSYSLSTKGFKTDRAPEKGEGASDFGWEIYPKGLYDLITRVYERYDRPIIITENGIADMNDRLRTKYIQDHLYWVKRAIDEGIPVQGYIYWTLMDNFEWDSGFWPRFGLIEINYETQTRRIRDSALELKKIIENK